MSMKERTIVGKKERASEERQEERKREGKRVGKRAGKRGRNSIHAKNGLLYFSCLTFLSGLGCMGQGFTWALKQREREREDRDRERAFSNFLFPRLQRNEFQPHEVRLQAIGFRLNVSLFCLNYEYDILESECLIIQAK